MSADDARLAGQELGAFLRDTAEQTGLDEAFGAESARTLRIEVDGDVWLKPGAAIAYRGDIRFERRPTLDAESIQDALLREVAPLVRAVGKGRLFCGRHGSHVRVVRLAGESFVVSWDDLLAFEHTLAFEPMLIGHGVGIAAGGLSAVRLTGDGSFAIATHGSPLTIAVEPGVPVSTDPHATLAWSAQLTPMLKTDLSWRSLFAHGGHEPVQMRFEGQGHVVVQPFEDPTRFKISMNPIKRVAALVTG